MVGNKRDEANAGVSEFLISDFKEEYDQGGKEYD